MQVSNQLQCVYRRFAFPLDDQKLGNALGRLYRYTFFRSRGDSCKNLFLFRL